jgi:hypothetical protein
MVPWENKVVKHGPNTAQGCFPKKAKKISAIKFKITGVGYDKNRGNKNYFRDDAPPEIAALAK